jgi:hypothetical protein
MGYVPSSGESYSQLSLIFNLGNLQDICLDLPRDAGSMPELSGIYGRKHRWTPRKANRDGGIRTRDILNPVHFEDVARFSEM